MCGIFCRHLRTVYRKRWRGWKKRSMDGWVIVSIVFWCWDDIGSRHGGEKYCRHWLPMCCVALCQVLKHLLYLMRSADKIVQRRVGTTLVPPVFCWWPAYHIYWEWQELSFGLIKFHHSLFFSRERHVTAAFSDILTCCHSRDGGAVGNANFIYQPETSTWWCPCIMHTG